MIHDVHVTRKKPFKGLYYSVSAIEPEAPVTPSISLKEMPLSPCHSLQWSVREIIDGHISGQLWFRLAELAPANGLLIKKIKYCVARQTEKKEYKCRISAIVKVMTLYHKTVPHDVTKRC